MQTQTTKGFVHSASSLYSESRIKELRTSALEHILSLTVWHEDGTALVRASDGSDNPQYRNAWFRDNMRIIRGLKAAGEEDIADSVWKGLFKTLQKYEDLMGDVIANPRNYSNDHCIPPRVVPETLERVPGVWTNVQEPQWLGELLFESATWLQNLIGNKDTKANTYMRLYRKATAYLLAIECFDRPVSNAWEQNPLDVYTSNIAASLAGLKTAKRLGVGVPNHTIEYGEKKLEERLNPLRESPTRGLDLSLFWLVNIYDVVPEDMKDGIVSQLIEGLGTKNGVQLRFGFPRYGGDVYYGLDDSSHNTLHSHSVPESPWPMAFTSLALHFASRPEKHEEYAHALEKAVNLRVNGKSVEQYVPNSNGAYIPRNPLAWADAQLLEALK